MKKVTYTKTYYDAITPGSSKSAQEVIPFIMKFIKPLSVIDVGCGTGTWLIAWQKAGISDFQGVDGKHISDQQLLIDKNRFIRFDLENGFTVNRKFDLVMSVEVAEHIDSSSAPLFIASLCKLGDVILFSAAIPGQGGVKHVNEQYPEYWASIFKQFGFSPFDCIREHIWLNKKIDTCYRQNLLFYVNDKAANQFPLIINSARPLLPLVHPEHFDKLAQILLSYKLILRTPFHAGWYFLKSFFRFFNVIKTK